MHRPEDSVIVDVLAGRAKPEEMRTAIAWFATEEGRAYLSAYMDKEYERDGLPVSIHLKPGVWRRIQWKISCLKWAERTFLLKVAAVVVPFLVLLGGALVANRYVDLFGTAGITNIELKAGMTRTMELPDGSKVYLGPGSRLSYPERFPLFDRSVRFSGDAYFEVAHQGWRPFIIRTGDVRIKVLGTAFNLMADASSSRINLRLDRGLVRLQSSSGDECYVRTGEAVAYDKDNGTFVREHPDTPASCVDWKTGTMQFDNAPLEDVLKYVAAAYNVRFDIVSPPVKTYRYTITWEKASLESILQDMATITPVRFRREGNRIVVK